MTKKKTMALCELTDQEKKAMMNEIEGFYLTVRDEEIGVIACQEILDFFLESLGNQIYNKALNDAHRWYQQMQGNLESDFYSLYKADRNR